MRTPQGELLALRVDSIQMPEEHWVITNLPGKAGHIRTVPIPAWIKVAMAIDKWKQASGITEGALFRSISKTGRVWGHGMTPSGNDPCAATADYARSVA